MARRSRQPLGWRSLWLGFAVAGGVLWAGCFGISAFRIAPWIALAPLFLLFDRRGATALVFAWGVAYWAISLHWIVPTMVTFGGLSAALTWPLFGLLAATLALYPTAVVALTGRVWRSPRPLVGMLAVAATWVALEWVRSWMLTGFPWNLAAYAWLEVPGALAPSTLLGAYGGSFMVVWANAGVARGLADRDWRPLAWGLLVPLAVLGTAWRWNERALADGSSRSGVLEARVLQPDIPNLTVWDPARNASDYRRLIAQSLEACDRPGTLLVWPESAAWPRRLGEDARLEQDLRELGRRGCSVILNTARREGGETFNAAVLVRPDGTRDSYDKQRLVPFGEFVPFRALLPIDDAVTRNVGDFSPGQGSRLLDIQGVSLGLAICYEVVFPTQLAATVAGGASVLVSMTNDDWYGPTAAAWQHLRAARFRAAETRRTLLRAAITGVSAVIGPDGGLVARAGPGALGLRGAVVRDGAGAALYVRLAPAVPWMAIVVSAFAILLDRRGRRPAAS